ncbi:MAG: hypothetical protein ACYTGC_00805 [Planctomycetota bacterium]|jgi:hypothetical protein
MSTLAIGSLCLSLAAPVVGLSPDDRIDLDVLYVGNAKTDRAEAFRAFLAARFSSAGVAERETFDPASADGWDVVLLDWSQKDVDITRMDALKSPLGDRDAWAHPTVLLGSAGLLISGDWQTSGSYG